MLFLNLMSHASRTGVSDLDRVGAMRNGGSRGSSRVRSRKLGVILRWFEGASARGQGLGTSFPVAHT